MQAQQKLFNKIVFTLRQRKLRSPPSAFRRTSGPLRFLFLSNANPLALGFALVWFYFHNAVSLSAVFQPRPLLPCFFFPSSVQFSRCKMVENSGIEPLTS